MRYFIEFAYKGKNFHGFQKQPNASSIQETLENALSLILHKNIEITGAGRTDTGVHAKQMFAHFDCDEVLNNNLVKKLNAFLTKDIAIISIRKVLENSHARFDAIERTYEYNIHFNKNPFLSDISWHFKSDLDIHLMNNACTILKEYTDFECFSKKHTDVFTFNCNIKEAFWQNYNDNLVFTITADRFLRNMVRAIVGTMINVGSQKISLLEFKKIIESKNRSNAGFSVPAHGLFLTKVKYTHI